MASNRKLLGKVLSKTSLSKTKKNSGRKFYDSKKVRNSSLLLENPISLPKSKRSQITFFVIIAIVIVVMIILFFIFRGGMFGSSVPKEFETVYSYYLSCIEQQASDGSKLLGQKGGRIEEIPFSPGSQYMPFSNELGFMGTGIPYWYYISGNGVTKEQVPSREKMQSDLNNFIKDRLKECDFSKFEEKGFSVNISNADVSCNIMENIIKVNVKQDIRISFGDKTWNGNNHVVNFNSNMGNFYNLALKIYENEKDKMFLENYGVDIIRLYAPVDGSDISCSPKLWSVNEIRNNLSTAIEANTAAIKISGDYYKLKKADNKYFVRDLGEKTDFNVNFMYSRYWPTKMEIWPSEDGILRADPIGLEQGLGIIGFCYVPYHFVYDLYYPVLIQIYSGGELFQFPVVVGIDKTQPKKSLVGGESLPDVVPDLCEHKIARMNIYTYNVNMQPVEANIKYKCFDTSCDIGKTKIENGEALLNGNFPQCSNGFVIASAEGYETKKELTSTIVDGSLSVVLTRKYKLNLVVHQRGSEIEGYAVVVLKKDNKTSTFAYPEMRNIELTEGQYDIKVYVYYNTSVHLQSSSSPKCVDIPKSGVEGFFGATEQKCFSLDIPSQDVSYGISGGGTQVYYFPESQLEKSKTLLINTEYFGVPKSLEDLQNNYNSVDISHLNIQLEES